MGNPKITIGWHEYLLFLQGCPGNKKNYLSASVFQLFFTLFFLLKIIYHEFSPEIFF